MGPADAAVNRMQDLWDINICRLLHSRLQGVNFEVSLIRLTKASGVSTQSVLSVHTTEPDNVDVNVIFKESFKIYVAVWSIETLAELTDIFLTFKIFEIFHILLAVLFSPLQCISFFISLVSEDYTHQGNFLLAFYNGDFWSQLSSS